MELPVIVIIGFVIQGIISYKNKKAGAIFGYVITTFVLLFGLTAYDKGNYIALAGIELPHAIFIFLCLIWYGFNTYSTVKAIRSTFKLNEALLYNEKALTFYKHTMDMWGTGILNELNKSFQKESKMKYDDFIKNYGPYEGGGFEIFLSEFPPLENEYFIGLGEKETGKERAWFILTNYRLLIRDGISRTFSMIHLSDIENFTLNGSSYKSFVFKLKSGEGKEIKNVEIYPVQKYLEFAIEQAVK